MIAEYEKYRSQQCRSQQFRPRRSSGHSSSGHSSSGYNMAGFTTWQATILLATTLHATTAKCNKKKVVRYSHRRENSMMGCKINYRVHNIKNGGRPSLKLEDGHFFINIFSDHTFFSLSLDIFR
jgi:hypothetical protein